MHLMLPELRSAFPSWDWGRVAGLIAWGLESKCPVGPILRLAVTSPRSEDAIVKCFDSPMLSGAFLDRTFGSTSNTLALMRPVCIGLRVHITEGHT